MDIQILRKFLATAKAGSIRHSLCPLPRNALAARPMSLNTVQGGKTYAVFSLVYSLTVFVVMCNFAAMTFFISETGILRASFIILSYSS